MLKINSDPPETAGCNLIQQEYVSAAELAHIFGISAKTITNNTIRIVGRVKIGGSVRYHLPTIRERVLMGKDIYTDAPEKFKYPPRPARKRSILRKTGSAVSKPRKA